MPIINQLDTLPDDLPVPLDDGACAHLPGTMLPYLALPATGQAAVDLAALSGRSVVFFYPRTGQPGQAALVDNWNGIPGARGCTPQSCGYRDLAEEFQRLGHRVFGLSTQTTSYQQEMVARLALPFPVLSDAEHRLTRSLSLPVFFAAGQELIKRMAWVVENGKIIKVFYPVFPPDQNASEVLSWVRAHPAVS
jgi:peroxiredoxin